MDHQTNVHELKEKVKVFCEARDWDKYHNAKELAIALSSEVGELLDYFRFKSEVEIDELFNTKRNDVVSEVADIFYCLLRLAQRYDIDLTTELVKKLKVNDEKYPVDKAKGSNKKYDEL